MPGFRVNAPVLGSFGRALRDDGLTVGCAPQPLRRLAARVERGQLTWAQVIAGTDDPDIMEFCGAALDIARSQFGVPDPDAESGTGDRSDVRR